MTLLGRCFTICALECLIIGIADEYFIEHGTLLHRSFDYLATDRPPHFAVSPSLCVSERGGGGEICPFSMRLLFPSLTDGDSSGERDLVL